MKRKNSLSENLGPTEPVDKRRRHNPGRSRSDAQFTHTSNRKDVGEDLLEGMGVNLIEDASNDSTDIPPKPVNINIVLKCKDTNVGNTSTDIHISEDYHYSESCLKKDRYLYDRFTLYKRKEPRTPRMDAFNSLADEIILLVFKWLPKPSLARCSLVCKKWHRLSKDDSLWRRVDLGLKNIQPGVIGQVLSRGCNVLRLSRSSISGPIFISPFCSTPTFSTSHTSKLQYLDLSMAAVDTHCLETLISTCQHLKKLALEHCDLSDTVCGSIGNNENLEVLHLALCSGLTEVGVSLILLNCQKLTELNISWTDLPEPGLDNLVDCAPKSLERLCIAGYRDTLQDSHVEKLISRCNRLQDLDLSDATKITSASINTIVENLFRLESLSTSRCYGITPSSYLLLINCPSLLYLNVFGLLREPALDELKERLSGIEINNFPLSSVARPTIGIKRTSLWNLRVRD